MHFFSSLRAKLLYSQERVLDSFSMVKNQITPSNLNRYFNFHRLPCQGLSSFIIALGREISYNKSFYNAFFLLHKIEASVTICNYSTK